MIEFDRNGLEQIRDWAQKRLDAHDRRLRFAPIRESFIGSFESMATQTIPEAMLQSALRRCMSAVDLENVLADYPDPEDCDMARLLRSAQARTASLRRMLEELS